MARYRVTYRGPFSVTLVGCRPGDAAYKIWQHYRENLQAGPVHFQDGTTFVGAGEETERIIATTVTFETVFGLEVDAYSRKNAVDEFLTRALTERMIPLSFELGRVSVEFVDGLEIPL